MSTLRLDYEFQRYTRGEEVILNCVTSVVDRDGNVVLSKEHAARTKEDAFRGAATLLFAQLKVIG